MIVVGTVAIQDLLPGPEVAQLNLTPLWMEKLDLDLYVDIFMQNLDTTTVTLMQEMWVVESDQWSYYRIDKFKSTEST